MKQINGKVCVEDWKICAFALIVGLIITILAWCLTHLSFIFTWLVITVISLPVWRQVATWAKKRYPHYELLDAMLTYIFSPQYNYVDEEDDYPSIEECE